MTRQDFTSGPPLKAMLLFTVPMVIGNLFQQLYGIADTAIVGQVLGTGALAAVGSTSSVTYLVSGFTGGLCSGFTIPIARCCGAGDRSLLRKYIANAIWLSIVFSVTVTLPALMLCRKILLWMQTPADIMSFAHEYLFTVFSGVPFVVLYNLASGVMRALGDSRTPLIFLVLSALLNVGLDIVFLLNLHTGVWGAALATVISQAFCGLLSFAALQRSNADLFPCVKDLPPRKSLIKDLCLAGVPLGLESSLTGIGATLLSASINTLGSTVVASLTAGNKVLQVLNSPLSCFGVVMAIYVSQNLGARNFKRIYSGLRGAFCVCIVYSAVSFSFNQLFNRFALALFLPAGQTSVFAGAQQFLFWNTLFTFSSGFSGLLRCTLQGVGYSALAMMAGISEMLTRSVMSFTLIPWLGALGAYLANPIAWSVCAAFLAVVCIFVLPRVEQRVKPNTL